MPSSTSAYAPKSPTQTLTGGSRLPQLVQFLICTGNTHATTRRNSVTRQQSHQTKPCWHLQAPLPFFQLFVLIQQHSIISVTGVVLLPLPCLNHSSGTTVILFDLGDLATISQVLLNRFPRFLSRFIGHIETLLSSPWTPETVRSLSRHRRRCFRRHSDLSQTRSTTVPFDFMLNRKLSFTPFYRPHTRIAASARSRDILIFVIIPHNSSSYLQCWPSKTSVCVTYVCTRVQGW